jgi:hypothetical protein
MDLRQPADPDDVACGVCREPVAPDHARLLASRDDLAVLELHCSACASVTLGFVFTTDAVRRRRGHAGQAATAAPVTADDVLDMHRHLEAWRGDLRSLLGQWNARDLDS